MMGLSSATGHFPPPKPTLEPWHMTQQAKSKIHCICQETVAGPTSHSSSHSMTSNVKKHLKLFISHQSQPDLEACVKKKKGMESWACWGTQEDNINFNTGLVEAEDVLYI